MRPSNKSRSRNKQGNSGGHNGQRRSTMGNIINRVFESAGPDGKVRGTPQQIIEKYQALARDAQVAGDRVAAESYLQFSEHYTRLLGEAQRQQQETRFNQERDERGGEDGGFDPQQRRPQPMPQQQPPVASGLAMIDPEDSDDFSGPVETPESRRQRHEEPIPVMAVESDREPERFERAPERSERPRERIRERAPRPAPQVEAAVSDPAPAPAVVAEAEAPVAQAEAPRPARAARRVETTPPAGTAPQAEAAPQPEAAAQAEAPVSEAEPAPAPKRRRRTRAEAPVPVVEAE